MPNTPATAAEEFRRLSPTGRVPVLVDGDFTLTESSAIMLYLAGLKPEGGLWPAENRARAEVMRWMSWSLCHWHFGYQPLQWERVVKPAIYHGTPDPAAVAAAEKVFHREAAVLDQHLAARQWLVGEALTLADFSVATGLTFAGPAQLPLTPYQAIRAWYARIEALPAWRQSVPRAM